MNNKNIKNNIIRTTLPGAINGYFELNNIDKLRESFDEIINKNSKKDKSILEADKDKQLKDIKVAKISIEEKDFKEIFGEEEYISDEISEFYEVNEETIFIENKNLISKKDIALAGLKYANSKKLSELEIEEYGSDFLKINKFLIQIVVTSPTSRDVLIPVNDWTRNKIFPQIILCAQVNDESNCVYFPGTLTAEEIYKEFEIFNNFSKTEFYISINKFKGGVNRLFSLLSILKSTSKLKLNWKYTEIEFFTSNLKKLTASLDFLVFLLKSGIPLGESYELLLENQKDQDIRSIFRYVIKCHKSGVNLGTALLKYPNIFDEISISLLNGALEREQLVESISIIAKRLKKKIYIDSEINKIFDMPIYFISWFLIVLNSALSENIAWAYQQWDISIPYPQKIIALLYAGNNFIFLFISLLFIVIYLNIKLPTLNSLDLLKKLIPRKINMYINIFILKIPILKEVKIKYSIFLFLRNLYYLLISGIPVNEALNITKKYEKTIFFKKLIDQISNNIMKGQSFYASIKDVRIFPKLLISFFRVGEEIGELTEIIGALSNFYEAELLNTLNIWKNTIKKYINYIFNLISFLLIIQIIGTFTTWILFMGLSN